MADLVFNHSEHAALLKTCKFALGQGNGLALCFFAHHRVEPRLVEKDKKVESLACLLCLF